MVTSKINGKKGFTLVELMIIIAIICISIALTIGVHKTEIQKKKEVISTIEQSIQQKEKGIKNKKYIGNYE